MFKHSRAARVRQPRPGVSPASTFRGERAPQMKFLRLALLAMFGLLLAVFVFAWFKRSTWSAEGVLLVEAPAEKILPLVDSPKHWLEWMPWCDPNDAGFEAAYSGPASGPGSKLTWKSNSRHGELLIQSASSAEGVHYALSIDDEPGEGLIRFEPYGTQTRVLWSYSGDMHGNLMARYAIPFMEKLLKPTLQKGLANLRERVTKGG